MLCLLTLGFLQIQQENSSLAPDVSSDVSDDDEESLKETPLKVKVHFIKTYGDSWGFDITLEPQFCL